MKKTKSILTNTVISGALALQGTIADAQDKSSQAAEHTETIRPFKVHFPDSDLKELRNRIQATRWPKRETVNDASQGVQLATIQKLASYWAKDYNWRKKKRS